jgi:hypothetical protein
LPIRLNSKQAITGHRTPDLAVRRPPASLPRAQHLEVRPDHGDGDEEAHEDPHQPSHAISSPMTRFVRIVVRL